MHWDYVVWHLKKNKITNRYLSSFKNEKKSFAVRFLLMTWETFSLNEGRRGEIMRNKHRDNCWKTKIQKQLHQTLQKPIIWWVGSEFLRKIHFFMRHFLKTKQESVDEFSFFLQLYMLSLSFLQLRFLMKYS